MIATAATSRRWKFTAATCRCAQRLNFMRSSDTRPSELAGELRTPPLPRLPDRSLIYPIRFQMIGIHLILFYELLRSR
jgi:hypothetical protein